MMDARVRGEELHCLIDTHREHMADALALVLDRQRFLIEATTAARIAQHPHIRQEIHLDLLHSLTFAGLAATAGRVEREACRVVAAHARLGGFGEQAADRVPESDVSRWAGARRLAYRRLIHFQNSVDSLPAGDLAT